MIDLSAKASQADIAELVGVSRQAISAMVAAGKLPRDCTQGEMVRAYCHRLREQAEGRLSADLGGLDLVQERAALTRSQRISQEMKNTVARAEFAPIGFLADVLAQVSSGVVDGFDQLEGAIGKACPTLPDEAKATVMTVIASARKEWIRATAKLAIDQLDVLDDDAPDFDANDAETFGT